jgi:hypothetical protein
MSKKHRARFREGERGPINSMEHFVQSVETTLARRWEPTGPVYVTSARFREEPLVGVDGIYLDFVDVEGVVVERDSSGFCVLVDFEAVLYSREILELEVQGESISANEYMKLILAGYDCTKIWAVGRATLDNEIDDDLMRSVLD